MCGLTGFVAPGAAPAEELIATLRRMRDAITHRGPDAAGEWCDLDCGVFMGFRRLAILDLSPAGDQPMISPSARYVATLNGEIYNFEELRQTLASEGHRVTYRGRSDTEVMLAAFDAWGVSGALARFNGMFAIAVWDRTSRRLQLIRDRMGVKPLYYGFAGRTFIYGSELKALRQHPDFTASLDRSVLPLYLRYLSVPEPYSIYEGIAKLPAGTILSFDPRDRSLGRTAFWSALDAARRGAEHRFTGSEEEGSREVERLLRDAVRLRTVADVPVGVFLSGGVDSSLIAALMQEQSPSRVRSFSIGFADAAYDEARFARAVAGHLGTDHTEVVMTPADVLDAIPRLPSIYDEPFADTSQIPTCLLSTVARRQVTVALSGDGGDEVFGGYVRYTVGQALLRRIGSIPAPMRAVLARAVGAVPPNRWNGLLSMVRPLLPGSLRRPASGERLHKLSRILAAPADDALYFELVSHWPELVDANVAAEAPVERYARTLPLSDPVERMMVLDQISYLPNDILTKVDRASMAVALEVREPLLDYRLVEFAWTLPLPLKVSRGIGKRPLRRILARYVPPQMTERPKMGFGVPLEHWLRGWLRDWAESLLDPREIAGYGLVDPAPIRAKWNEHLAGKGDWKHQLWAILMLQAWLRDVRSPARIAA
jgi:asparagine synthase (glutamine-hydrolysing)